MKKALSLVLALLMLMSLCITPVMAAEPEGSESNPYYVANPMNAPGFITIPANSAVYYQYKAAVFNGWEVGGYGLTSIIVDGVVYDKADMWGEIYAPLNFNMMSPGIVAYVNDTAEEVQVMITHNEPLGTIDNPAELLGGDNALSIPASIMEYVTVYLPTTNGEFTFSTAQYEDFIVTVFADGSPAEGGTPLSLEKGSLTLTLESYIPVYVVTTPVGVTGDVVLTVTEPKAGTADNPIWLDPYGMFDSYTVDGDLYFQLDGSLTGNTLLIASADAAAFTATIDGVEYASVDGVITAALADGDWYFDMVVSGSCEITFAVEYAEGTLENPFELVLGDNAVSIPEGGSGIYFEYVVEKDGLLVVTPSVVDGIGYLTMSDEEYNDAAALQDGASSMMMAVTAGETISVEIGSVMDEETWENLALETILNVVQKDLVLYTNFEDGLGGWSSDSTLTIDEEEYASRWYSAKFEAIYDWANIYNYINLEANTDYAISFKAKAALNKGAWIKFNDNWGPDIAKADVSLTTEWADYEVTLNSGNHTSAVLLLQYAGYAADGQIIWIDDFVITKAEKSEPDVPAIPDEPGDDVIEENPVRDGSFETAVFGDDWRAGGDCAFTTEYAHTGDYGMLLKASTAWAGINQKNIVVEPNTDYILTFWYKYVDGDGCWNVYPKNSDGSADLAVNGQRWVNDKPADWTQRTLEINTGDNSTIRIYIQAENPNGTYAMDDFVLVKKPTLPDGYVCDEGFEHGFGTWGTNAGATIETVPYADVPVANPNGGDYALKHTIPSGAYPFISDRTPYAVKPNTDYTISIDALNTSANWPLEVKVGTDYWFGGSVFASASFIPSTSAWGTYVFHFNSGDNTELYFGMKSQWSDTVVYFDNYVVTEKTDDPGDEPDVDAVWSTDFNDGDKKFTAGEVVAEGPDGSNCLKWTASGGWSSTYVVLQNMDPGKDYSITMKMKASIDGTMGITIQNGDWGSYWNAPTIAVTTEWKEIVYTIPANSIPFTAGSIMFKFQDVGKAMDLYVDDIVIVEGLLEVPGDDSSYDGFITNGDFETGNLTNWINLYEACTVEFVEGYESDYALSIAMPKQWQQVRQDKIAVEANTTYRLSAYVKNAQNVSFVVKEGNDSFDLTPAETGAFPAGDEWQLFTMEFNTGVNKDGDAITIDSICILVISYGENGGSVIIDNITLEKVEEPEVPAYLPGDVSGDGKVNNRDLGMLQQYLSDMDVKITNMNACDVTGDGKVNNRDLGILQQYLSDMDVELKFGAIEE